MYGRKRYRPLNPPAAKPTELPQQGSPTFICAKCKTVKQLLTKYSDILITLDSNAKMCYRICGECFDRLEQWIKA